MSIYFEKTYQRAFGTFPLQGEELAAALRTAIEVVYRAIDTAQMYGNEADGGALYLSLIPTPGCGIRQGGTRALGD